MLLDATTESKKRPQRDGNARRDETPDEVERGKEGRQGKVGLNDQQRIAVG